MLREFSLDALVATSLAAVTGDIVSRAFFGSAPFFSQVPHGLSVANDSTYLLVAVLALIAGLIGVAFKTFLYWLEDFVDELWKGRPEWARPAVGGVALGGLLLAVPQMYGVGYPVMNNVIDGHVVLGLMLLFLISKILATSLTLSIGGSGGVFAPSLFIGAMTGMAFGTLARNVFGPEVGPPAIYAVVAMGGVFAAAAQAPLTAIASVAEMTGNFGITLPIMLASAIAAAISKHLSYGSIYTTKLLRRGIDIERPKTTNLLQKLTVAGVMQSVPQAAETARLRSIGDAEPGDGAVPAIEWERLAGPVTNIRRPQELFADETLEQALRQLTRYGHAGLPVLSHDRERLEGWITHQSVMGALAQAVRTSGRSIERGAIAADFAAADPESQAHQPSTPLDGYQSSRSPSAPTHPRSAGALTRSPGPQAASSSPSPKTTKPPPSTATRP